MDRSVKRDIQKRYQKMTKEFEQRVNEVGCYVCEQCGQATKVRQAISGSAPGGIECPYCHGDAFIAPDTYPNVQVTYEWYRPMLEEVLAMAEEHMFTVNYILNGGLLRRSCSQS